MTATTIDAADVERFRSVVSWRLGLLFEDAKLGSLAEVLRRRLDSQGCSCGTYLDRLESQAPGKELSAVAAEVTVGETYFFRHIDQFRAFAEAALPERMRAQAASRRIQILSAGCASGEEAYSLAILVREEITDPSWDVSILGVDVNAAALEKGSRGRFSAWALRETPVEARRRWFRPDGRELVLDEAIRSSVRLEQRNLVAEDPELWQPEAYDVIFCRNVIMYFTPAGAQAAIAGITRALAPGGYLFLGHAETLRGLSSDFHLRHTHGAFYYQRKERIEPAGFPVTIAAELRAVPHGGGPVAAVEGAETWVDAIRKAAARIQALTAAPERPPSQAPVPQPADSRWELGLALDLLRRERFSEALEVLRALPPGSGHDPDVLLLHAVLLTHGGQLARAEEECRRLLEVDELNAGAHYLLALTREGAGDRRAAAEHDQTAAYLDSGFAMPRLHLGLLARRAGEAETARRELEQALALLQREDPSRLLLFGGGFSREALVGLCRTELLACGGRP